MIGAHGKWGTQISPTSVVPPPSLAELRFAEWRSALVKFGLTAQVKPKVPPDPGQKSETDLQSKAMPAPDRLACLKSALVKFVSLRSVPERSARLRSLPEKFTPKRSTLA
jgi:hypothetical protein